MAPEMNVNHPLRDTIRIMALKVNGLRKANKTLALGKYLANLTPQPDACNITDSQLCEWEVKMKIHINTYVVAHKSCRRTEDVQQACGGVLILVKKGLQHMQQNEFPVLRQP